MRIVILLASFFFLACSTHQNSKQELSFLDQNTSFKVKDTKTKRFISYDDLLNTLKKQDIIILGEYHDEKKHHDLELALVKELSKNEPIAIAFEMLDDDKQGFINKAKDAKARIKPSHISKALSWQDEWNYEDYKDLIEYALYSNNDFLAVNLSQDKLDMVYNKKLAPLQGKYSTASKVKKILFDEINSFHAMSPEVSEIFVEAQLRKDRNMAEFLLASKKQIVLIAGLYHANKSLGIPLHLMDLDTKQVKSVSVVALEGSEIREQDADFIIFWQ
ncbi:hypothetical protein DMB95_05535 [Campylobacter sp. MIT 12-8780]|uniref:ChaN family lipoprotein n=1 Tax=unclassified Campylobacter TaxID=2593542 RepID=UPI00115C4861|nr:MULTISPECIES: ChaN family lipoprotein [unclassified Campylobacter]NDJ27562.1 hypothetical protein [Campylobacter sp. MIT 19-121]TQR41314.1 hypothetical protein DMB95_05535 [Campylobacter sp. MIT 12-8780]